jgi:hypothetical protein
LSKSVTVSIATNSVITGSKLFGFLTTGSPTLFAETIHSATDDQPGLVEGRRGQVSRPPNCPFGFGKERYFWALVSSISVLFLGCGASVRHGIEALLHHEPGVPFSNIAIALLLLAGVLESYTCHIAWREIGGWSGLRKARANVLAVLLEDVVVWPELRWHCSLRSGRARSNRHRAWMPRSRFSGCWARRRCRPSSTRRF